MADLDGPGGDPGARLEKWRRTTGLFLAPALFAAVLALPTGLEPKAHRLAAVFALVIVLWVSEAIPLPATALLGPALTIPLGVAAPREAFASFGHPIIFLFMGSFFIARAMMLHGLDRRIALFVLSRSWVGSRPGRVLLAFGVISMTLSMWMSNTATTAMMLPIGVGVLRTLTAGGTSASREWASRYGTGLLLLIAFSCNIGGVATPVGTPPNLIAIGMFERILEYRVSFFDWMRFGVPIAGASFVFLYLLVRWLYCRREERIEGAAETIRRERATLGPWRPGEVVALCSFLLAVVLWTVPGVLSLALGREAPLAEALDRMLPEASSAILAAALLFLIPVDWKRREFALDWREAARIDWGTILLFGGGLSLGSLAFSTGLARALGAGVLERSGALPVWLAALLALYTANVLTEFMSNTATANLLIPMFLALAGTGAALPGLPALAATIGCSFAFCLPVATPPNAIVYGSGLVPLSRMIRLGVLLDLGCGLIAWALLLLIV